mmetsp:Transcript_60678/g.179946  ORF Transcript_60678/g.179946 Transcript_60678/m.179946 type:complete len:246 (+) Transcript_60678:506-1243(+)
MPSPATFQKSSRRTTLEFRKSTLRPYISIRLLRGSSSRRRPPRGSGWGWASRASRRRTGIMTTVLLPPTERGRGRRQRKRSAATTVRVWRAWTRRTTPPWPSATCPSVTACPPPPKSSPCRPPGPTPPTTYPSPSVIPTPYRPSTPSVPPRPTYASPHSRDSIGNVRCSVSLTRWSTPIRSPRGRGTPSDATTWYRDDTIWPRGISAARRDWIPALRSAGWRSVVPSRRATNPIRRWRASGRPSG